MSKVYNEIGDALNAWIVKQKIFFVSTAPLAADGLINCSPKGLDSFRILSPSSVVYQDLTGSGVETIAHLKENKRITIMFCAFDGPPLIVRLQGLGEVIEPGHAEYDTMVMLFPNRISTRAFIRVTLNRVADSCGYAVPKYQFTEDRDVLDKWADRKGEAGIREYQLSKNMKSLEGLPGLTHPK